MYTSITLSDNTNTFYLWQFWLSAQYPLGGIGMLGPRTVPSTFLGILVHTAQSTGGD